MKKIIIIAILLIGTFNTIAQDSITNNKNQLELIADELDISEKQAYDSLIQQQRVQSFRNLMIFGTMFLSMWSMKRIFNSIKNKKEDDNPQTQAQIAYYNACKEASIAQTTYFAAEWTGKDEHGMKNSASQYDSPNKPNFIKLDAEKTADKLYSAKDVIFLILSLAIFIGSIIYNSVMLSETFTGLFNPEYGALEQLNFLKK